MGEYKEKPKVWDDKYLEEIKLFEETVDEICLSDKTIENVQINEIGELLTKEEKEEIAINNYNLVYGILKKFQNSYIDASEIESLSLVGFTRALNSYRKNSTTKFSSYCFVCMQNEVKTYLKKIKSSESITDSVDPMMRGINEETGDNFLLKELFKDTAPNLEDQMVAKDIVQIIRESIDEKLTDKEAYIIKARYCIDGFEYKNQIDLARLFNVSQASISKSERSILAKLRVHLIAKYKIRGVSSIL